MRRSEVEVRALQGIPASVGGCSEFGTELKLEVFPGPDLVLERSCSFDVNLPKEYPVRPPSVRCRSIEALPSKFCSNGTYRRRGGDEIEGTIDTSSGRVRLGLLDEKTQCGWSRSYDLAVLFYGLRRLFSGADHSPWDWFPTPPGRHATPDKTTTTTVATRRSRPTTHHHRRVSIAAVEASTRGRRREMEDVTTVIPDAGLVCLFDGHGGRGCAAWAGRNVPRKIVELAARLDPREAMWRAFVDADREWVAGRQDTSGCTAIAALFRDRTLYVANLGDCRCVLARRGRSTTLARDLSFDARADRPDEIARICAARGFVANRRVNGQLAVSRALGDVAYKHYVAGSNRGPVSSRPDVVEIALEPADDFLVVACDGLWDVLSSQAVVDFVRSNAEASTGNLKTVCEKLVRHAVDDKKSTDNVSVCLVKILHYHATHRSTSVGLSSTPRFPFGASATSRGIRTLSASSSSSCEPPSIDHLGSSSRINASLMGNARLATFAARPNPAATSKRLSTPALAAPKIADNDDDLFEYLLDDRNFAAKA
ncbi:hypothetical protein CTAYLR_004326 [Chrysophaeum taylorii]|uniref:protein-serine/threonine phosphatase n=1 Tax=Chrysophaeum taylorii TaxID=2483200 RepID=A0AAD7XLQ3_9STRA|nr:hypothetical protein CTAYLR_004326 [Chrysophaeum taylorii]